jgi:hypothetical protein
LHLQAITGGMILGEIGKSSPFYGSKGFIPSNSTLDPEKRNGPRGFPDDSSHFVTKE